MIICSKLIAEKHDQSVCVCTLSLHTMQLYKPDIFIYGYCTASAVVHIQS